MDLFNLAAKISLDDGKFNEGIARAEKAGKGLGSSLENTFGKIASAAKALAAGVAIKKVADTIIGLANATAEAGDRIDKQSQVLGMSRKAYQEWDYILGQNGASIDAMGVSMKTLNNLILESQEGSKEAKNAFAKLGLGIHEIENLNPEDQFEAVVRAFQAMPAGAKKSALAVQIFGRNGMDLLPLLNQSATSIDELRQRAQELGIIMSDDAVDASVKYGDTLDDLKRTFNALKYSVGAQLLPALTNGVERVAQFTSRLMGAFNENGIEGAWDFLVDAFRNIRWPTAAEITQTLSHIWDGVRKAAKSILVLVFGEDENGNIQWPTASELWAKIKSGLTILWNGIQAMAGDVLKLIFGEDADGNIQWPTEEQIAAKVRDGLETMWDAVKTVAGGIMKLIFGTDADGNIQWPTAEEIGVKVREGIQTMWNGIKTLAKEIFKFIFGESDDGGIQWPSAVELWTKIKGGLNNLWKGIKAFAKGLLKIDALGILENGITWPTAMDVYTKIKSKVQELWNGLTLLMSNIVKFAIDDVKLPDIQKTIDDINKWWNGIKQRLTLSLAAKFTGIDMGGGSAEADMWNIVTGLLFNAKGTNYVPYDDYVTRLHRGEMVLTASQARRYREGEDGGGLDVNQLAGAIIGAVREGMNGATVNSYLSGRNVTDDVNRNTIRQLKARRFAT